MEVREQLCILRSLSSPLCGFHSPAQVARLVCQVFSLLCLLSCWSLKKLFYYVCVLWCACMGMHDHISFVRDFHYTPYTRTQNRQDLHGVLYLSVSCPISSSPFSMETANNSNTASSGTVESSTPSWSWTLCSLGIS